MTITDTAATLARIAFGGNSLDHRWLQDALADGCALVRAERTPEAERRAGLDERDEMIRQLRADRYPGNSITVTAKLMAAHLESPERVEDAAHRDALERISELHGRDRIGWTTLYNIFLGRR